MTVTFPVYDDPRDAPLTIRDVQRQQRAWQEHNFPGRKAWMPLLGAIEEIGELAIVAKALSAMPRRVSRMCAIAACVGKAAHAVLKTAQGIRGTPEQHRESMLYALHDAVNTAMMLIVRNDNDTEIPCLENQADACEARDAIADTVIFLSDVCNAHGWDLEGIVVETWKRVRQRDFKKDAVRGGEAAQ